MRKILALFASRTSALQIKKYLFSEYKIKSEVIPTPEKLEISGCGFALKANYESIAAIKKIISDSHLNSKGIFDFETGKKL